MPKIETKDRFKAAFHLLQMDSELTMVFNTIQQLWAKCLSAHIHLNLYLKLPKLPSL